MQIENHVSKYAIVTKLENQWKTLEPPDETVIYVRRLMMAVTPTPRIFRGLEHRCKSLVID